MNLFNRLIFSNLHPVLILGLLMLPGAALADQATAIRLYEDALTRFDSGDYRGASVQLKNALREDPDNLPARVLMGRSQNKLGNAASAEKDLRLARSAGADDELVLVPLGNAYFAQRKYDAILEELRSGGRNPEVESAILTLRGKALLETGKGKLAEEAFKRAARLRPEAVEPLLGQVLVLMRNGKLAEARQLLDQATELEPRNPEVWFIHGDLARLNQDTSAALAGYDKAIRLQETHLEARKSRAAVLMTLGQDDKAREDVDYIRERDPIDPQVTYLHAFLLARAGDQKAADAELQKLSTIMAGLNKEFVDSHGPTMLLYGMVEYMLGHMDRAQVYLDRYVRNYPGHAGARMMLGDVLIQKGDAKTAILILSPVLQAKYRDARLYTLLGQAYMLERDFSAATEMFEKAAQLEPEDPDIYTAMAKSRMATGNTLEAAEDLAQALQLDAGDPATADMIGMLQLQSRDFAEALKSAERLVALSPDLPKAHNMLGSANLGLGRLEAARMAFEKALALDPAYRPAALNLANLDIREARLESARSRLQNILKQDSRDVQAILGLSRLAEAEGKPREAIQWLEQLLNINPDLSYEKLRLAELYLAVGEAQNALEIAKTLDKHDPTNLNILELLGRAHLAVGAKQDAAAVFRSMYGFARESVDWLQKIANHQIEAEDYENAAELLQEILRREPDNLPAMTAKVRLLMHTGELEPALALTRRIRQAHPDLAGGDLLAGDVLMRQGKYNQAVAAYSKAFAKQQTSPLVIRKYRGLRAAGRRAEAWRVLDDWLKTQPQDRQVRRILASNHMKAGRYKDAIRHFEYLLKGAPDSAVLQNNLANLYQLTKRSEDALRMARSAYALNPRHAAISDTLGWILVQNGRPEEGLKYLREAESRASRAADIKYHIGVALYQLGREADAVRALRDALDGGEDFPGQTDALVLLQKIAGR